MKFLRGFIVWLAYSLQVTSMADSLKLASNFKKMGASIAIGAGLLSPVPLCVADTATTTSSSYASSFGPTPSYAKSFDTGLEYYDYPQSKSEGPPVVKGDKVKLNIRAYLAGRQGWIYIDTFKSTTGEAVKFTVGDGSAIEGLELGLLGDKKDMTAMRKGSKRRILIPSRLGYTSKTQLPLPEDEGSKRRLLSTVLNPVRVNREKAALGDSIVGKLILDVQLIKILK